MIPYMVGKLDRIALIPSGDWSNMSPVGAIFVPSPLKTGTNLLHPLPLQSLNGSVLKKQCLIRDRSGMS